MTSQIQIPNSWSNTTVAQAELKDSVYRVYSATGAIWWSIWTTKWRYLQHGFTMQQFDASNLAFWVYSADQPYKPEMTQGWLSPFIPIRDSWASFQSSLPAGSSVLTGCTFEAGLCTTPAVFKLLTLLAAQRSYLVTHSMNGSRQGKL